VGLQWAHEKWTYERDGCGGVFLRRVAGAFDLVPGQCELGADRAAVAELGGNFGSSLKPMAIGPGKYDALCTEAREKAKAQGAVLMILEGEQGWGFSVQVTPIDLLLLPRVLRHIADKIEHGA